MLVLPAAFGLFLLGRWLWWKFSLKGWLDMNRVMKIVAVVGLALAVGGVLAFRNNGQTPVSDGQPAAPGQTARDASNGRPLPRLVSLGAGKCVPCKMMDPIREELRGEYAGRLQVVYHDVWQNRAIGERYGIRLIPTLIYFDAAGRELGRTEGYRTKQQIIDAFGGWGVDLNEASPQPADARVTSDATDLTDSPLQFAATSPSVGATPEPSITLGQAYPLFGDGPFGAAWLTALPEGQLLRAGEEVIRTADLQAMLDEAPPQVRTQLGRHQLFLLEQLAMQRLVAAQARRALAGQPDATPATDEQAIVRYLRSVAAEVEVSDDSIREFYQANSAMMGGATLEQVKEQIQQYLLEQAQQAQVAQHVQTLVSQADIQLHRPWVEAQAAAALDNPVDRTRASGKPAMIDFGAHGCGPCDMMTPILECLAKTYAGRAEILFVPVNEHQILAARYGVQGIPTQIFFDAMGREVFRHTGFLAQDKIESKLAELGVR